MDVERLERIVREDMSDLDIEALSKAAHQLGLESASDINPSILETHDLKAVVDALQLFWSCEDLKGFLEAEVLISSKRVNVILGIVFSKIPVYNYEFRAIKFRKKDIWALRFRVSEYRQLPEDLKGVFRRLTYDENMALNRYSRELP